jgi:hypothetical protein
MISAWQRETRFCGMTTSQMASRPNTNDEPSIAYSRPSVKLTKRPPVPAVAFRFAAGLDLNSCNLAMSAALTN